jgi:tetratricopeptide (TPR) repeat protein
MRVVTTALCALLLCWMTAATAAVDRVLEEIDLVPDPDGTTIQVKFNTPIRYISHSPRTNGDVLLIQIQPLLIPGIDPQDLQTRENLQWTATKEAPLLEVTYDGELPSATEVTLRFNHSVRYRVAPGADNRSLEVTVISPTPRGNVSVGPTEVIEKERKPPPVVPLPPPTPAQPGVPEEEEVPAMPAPEEVDTSLPYVINLAASSAPVAPDKLPNVALLRQYRVYTTPYVKDGKRWYRLRLGFFADEASAKLVLAKLKPYFPDAWVAEAPAAERKASGKTALALIPAAEAAPGRLGRLMQQGRDAITSGDNETAIRLLTKVLETPGSRYAEEAQELLGVARERNGQLAQARAEYESFLKRYPQGDAAKRVRQRLAGLLTAAETPKRKLRPGRRRPGTRGALASEAGEAGAAAKPTPYEVQVFGGISQFYRHDVEVNDQAPTRVLQSGLANDLDLSARARNNEYDLRARVSAGYRKDMLAKDANQSRVSNVYVEATQLQTDRSIRIGRQTLNKGGVLGRFDGATAGWRLSDYVKLNVVGGYPVQSSVNTGIRTHEYMVGVNADLGTFANAWDFNVYAIEQRVHGLLDRRAVGGEARYFKNNKSLFGLVDYDVSYSSLNTLLLLGNWFFKDGASLSVVYDHRKSPILTTSNALQGQLFNSLRELKQFFGGDPIRQFAEDRTATTDTVTIGGSKPLSQRFLINADVTSTYTSSTTASGGVPANPAVGVDMYYSAQLVGSNLWQAGDTAVLGFRYADTHQTDTTTVFISTRHPITHKFRLTPRVRVDHQVGLRNTETWVLSPMLRADYLLTRRMQLEVESGGAWSIQRLPDSTWNHIGDWYALFGYRYDF